MGFSFTLPTLEERHQLLLADHQNRFPEDDVSKFSDTWKRLRTQALAAQAIDARLDTLYEDLLPDGANDAQLDRFGNIYDVARKPATAAYQTAALRVLGATGANVTIGDELTHKDGTRYQANSSATIPSGGYVDVDVLALDVGSVTRKQAGEILTFTSPAPGITSAAALQLDLSHGGDDVEDNGSYRVRILDKMAQPGMGGNANDYRVWALEVDGIGAAYVWSKRNGLGSVDVAALHNGTGDSERTLTEAERAAVETYILALRPVSVADFRVLTCVAEPNDIEVTVTPQDDDAFAFDWDDSSPPVVSAWNNTLRKLTFTAGRKPDIQIGSRLIYKSTGAPYGDGSELIVESLSSTDAVIVTVAPTNPPVNGDVVYSGGPLVEPIREQLQAMVDALGPGTGEFAAIPWEGTLRRSTIFKLVQLYPGVLDSNPVTPASNVDPTNTAPLSTVGYVVARQIIVRKG